jgi:hypothetical protein
MWIFCVRSLVREYGWRFAWRVAGRHPLRTLRAVREAASLEMTPGGVEVTRDQPVGQSDGPPLIVGLGFCLKPMIPPCPSGRPNHDCQYLENLPRSEGEAIPVACGACAIREIGLLALDAGAAVYVMTSARDILYDVFVPALDHGRFSSGVFALCGYSVRPFAVGLLASGIRGWLFPFAHGDCRDYKAWLLADRGSKDDQTTLDRPTHRTIRGLLDHAAERPPAATQFEKRGHVLYARTAGGNCASTLAPGHPAVAPDVS